MTSRNRLTIALSLGLALVGAAATLAADGLTHSTNLGDQEMEDCLATPGLEDITGFTHRATVFVDDRFWYLAAPELILAGTQVGQGQDLPGHCWKAGPDAGDEMRYVGKHFNTGPLGGGGLPKFWSSDSGEHEQLYWVDLIISPWSPKIAKRRARDGYVHYHELVLKDDGCFHPDLVAWMRHSAISSFTLDGGPPRFREDGIPFRPRNVAHETGPGLDLNFMPNYDLPYVPELICGID